MLENAGSVARDHLASERTFLAYVRTSLAISMAGVGKRFRIDFRCNSACWIVATEVVFIYFICRISSNVSLESSFKHFSN